MFACVTGFVLGYASKRVVVSCFVRGHNHGSAGAAQHLENCLESMDQHREGSPPADLACPEVLLDSL
jgi:hypothetical protein